MKLRLLIGQRSAAARGQGGPPAPLHRASGRRVPDSFIVVYDPATLNPDAKTDALAAKYGFATSYRYEHALKGFAATLTLAAVAGLRSEPGVAYIEEDQYVRAAG